ncbi:MAG TPA: LLM class flavin-dependent oxidoreductase [Chloroflexota bacterium]|nr:LLM class flavin-dependent oxidoreductase [Chloroflexota bacterium]
MKFGLLYLPTYVPELDGPVGTFYDRMLEQIARAEELGFQSVWLTEHHFNIYGGTISNPAVFGAAIARATQRIRIGTAVTVLPLHNPLLVAEDFAMLDVLSDGRLDFGIGRGSVSAEYREFGIATDGVGSASVMAEGSDLILRAWSEERFSFRGQHFSYDDISLWPRPVQQPHPPIYVGAARTPDTFAWAGQRGYHVMVLPYMFPPEFLHERLGLYRDALRGSGHDPSSVDVLAKFHVFVADSAEEASRVAGPAYDNYQRIARNRSGREHQDYWRAGTEWDDQVRAYKIIAGAPDDCIERIRYWRDTLGINHLGGTFHFGGLSQEATLRSIELFAREVAPAFASEERAAAA